MKQGSIVAVCRSDRKGIPKRSITEGRLVCGHGLDQDAHAGNWHRQVSVLDIGDIREMEAKGLTLRPGAFGENLILADINTSDLGLGSRLRLGEAEIEITQIGKVCHDRCAIYYSAGDCIMPRRGLFAEVRAAGKVRAGQSAEVVHKVPREHLQLAVLESIGSNGKEIITCLEAQEDVHLAWSGVIPRGTTMKETIQQLCGRGLDLLFVVSHASDEFSNTIDPGTEVVVATGLRGRISKTHVALVRPDQREILVDSFVSEWIAEIRRGLLLAPPTLPTLSIPVAGA